MVGTQARTDRQSDRVGLYSASFSLVSLGGVRLSPLGTSATVGLFYDTSPGW
jgi:hypothetical protein